MRSSAANSSPSSSGSAQSNGLDSSLAGPCDFSAATFMAKPRMRMGVLSALPCAITAARQKKCCFAHDLPTIFPKLRLYKLFARKRKETFHFADAKKIRHLFYKELEHCLFMDLIAHCRHVIALGHCHRAAIGEGGRQRTGWAGERIILAANNQHRPHRMRKLFSREAFAIGAHASRKRKPVFARLIGEFAKIARRLVRDLAFVGFE